MHQPPNPIRLEWDFPKPVSLLSLWLPSGACPVLSAGMLCTVCRHVMYCLQACPVLSSGLSCIVFRLALYCLQACYVLSAGLSCIVFRLVFIFRLVLYCLQAFVLSLGLPSGACPVLSSGLSCTVCRHVCCLWDCCPVLPVSVPSLVVAFWDSCPGACIKALVGGCFGQT